MEDSKILEYCIEYSQRESELLRQLRRETHLKTMQPHMISGPLQGQLLTMLVRMIKPKNVLEVGTFTGYASICLANGLGADGMLYTIEIDPELEYFHKKFFPMSKVANHIKTYLGDSNDLIPKMKVKFDFAFIDAGKKDYMSQYAIVLEKMNTGGIILADNVLWKGKVAYEEKDKITKIIDDFNHMVVNDPRVENVILPIRDGINLIVKK